MLSQLIPYIWFFFIYGFLGWCMEVIYAASCHGKFVNRGFLNGPSCPIYGFGMVVVVWCLTPLKENVLVLFLGSVLLTTLIELVTGFCLERFFHNQWWDYSNIPFNFHGYICLKFSLLWGIACTMVMDIVHPAVEKVVAVLCSKPGYILLVLCCLAMLADTIETIADILKFNKRLEKIDEVAQRLHQISEEIGSNLSEGTITAMEKGEEWKENLESKKQKKEKERLETKEQMEKLLSQKMYANRMLHAFPDMKNRAHGEALSRLKEYMRRAKQDKMN